MVRDKIPLTVVIGGVNERDEEEEKDEEDKKDKENKKDKEDKEEEDEEEEEGGEDEKPVGSFLHNVPLHIPSCVYCDHPCPSQ